MFRVRISQKVVGGVRKGLNAPAVWGAYSPPQYGKSQVFSHENKAEFKVGELYYSV